MFLMFISTRKKENSKMFFLHRAYIIYIYFYFIYILLGILYYRKISFLHIYGNLIFR